MAPPTSESFLTHWHTVKLCSSPFPPSCWISPDGDAIWAFHGPVIAVLLVGNVMQCIAGVMEENSLSQINVVVLVYVVTVIIRLTMRKEENACLLV